jgi:Concanavalin A-like lectin/glucanases superfamily
MKLGRKTSARTGVVLGTALLCALGPSAVATTSGHNAAPARGAVADRVRFTFDAGETLKAGTRVRDVSGHRNFGIVRVSGGGHLTLLRNGARGHAAGFPRICRGCGRAIITVDSRPSLNPGTRPFSFGASVRATPKQAPPHRDPNIILKGNTLKGKYKLHLIGARPRCVFAGAISEVVLTSPTPIDNGTWHRVVCSKDGKTHRLFVDGRLKAQSTTRASGSIISPDRLKVGGRAIGHAGSNDQFHGDLDNVFLHVVPR